MGEEDITIWIKIKNIHVYEVDIAHYNNLKIIYNDHTAYKTTFQIKSHDDEKIHNSLF